MAADKQRVGYWMRPLPAEWPRAGVGAQHGTPQRSAAQHGVPLTDQRGVVPLVLGGAGEEDVVAGQVAVQDVPRVQERHGRGDLLHQRGIEQRDCSSIRVAGQSAGCRAAWGEEQYVVQNEAVGGPSREGRVGRVAVRPRTLPSTLLL